MEYHAEARNRTRNRDIEPASHDGQLTRQGRMTLLAVERIKLLTTRSPWWCAIVCIVLTSAFTALIVGNTPEDVFPVSVAMTQYSYTIGLAVIMVLGALAVTTEYRFGTIRTTFQAVPNRTAALLAKATVVAVLALLIGELTAFTSWGVSLLLAPEADLALDSAADVINVAGVGIIYALSAVIAVAVGALVRHSAGAICAAVDLVFAAEEPGRWSSRRSATTIHEWLPFNVAHKFLTGDGESSGGDSLAARRCPRPR